MAPPTDQSIPPSTPKRPRRSTNQTPTPAGAPTPKRTIQNASPAPANANRPFEDAPSDSPTTPTSGLRGGVSRRGSAKRKRSKSKITTPKKINTAHIHAPTPKKATPKKVSQVEPNPPHHLIRTPYTTTPTPNPPPQTGFLTLKYGQGSDGQAVKAKFSEALGGSWWYGSDYDASLGIGHSYVLGSRGWKRDLQGRVLSREGTAGNGGITSTIHGVAEGGAKDEQEHYGKMVPVSDPKMGEVQDALKSVIQNLFDIQMNIHGYQDETHPYLVEKMIDLTTSLSTLQQSSQPSQSSSSLPSLPPELIDYVDEGRNPDIYTREFVELAQRGNAVINGKREGFRSFSEVLAGELVREGESRKQRQSGGVNMEKAVAKVMRNAGIEKPAEGWGADGGDMKRESVSGNGVGIGMGNGMVDGGGDVDGDRKMGGT